MKGKLKRILSLALLAILLAGAVNLPGLSPAARAEDGFNIWNNILTGYTGPGGIVRIPRGVWMIADEVFKERSDITGVVIPDTVTVIGKKVFYYCTGLTVVAVPNTVKTIGEGAFQLCTGLKKVTLPKGLKTIEAETFQDCNKLTGISIPNTVDVIGKRAFKSCVSLKNVTLPKGVTEIGESAFASCYSLTDIAIPNTVDEIGERAFETCYSLKKVILPKGVTEIGNYTFSYCTSLTSVTIPNTVLEIGRGAFETCYSLKKINIPKGVMEIGRGAFSNCTSLIGVTIPNTVVFIGVHAFSSCSGLKRVTILDAVMEIGTCAFYRCTSLASVNFGNGLDKIWDNAFEECIGLNDIILPGSVTFIGQYAFGNCTGLTSVVIPDSVSDIAADAFDDCPNLRFATLPSEAQAPDFAGSAPVTTVIPDNLLPPAVFLREGQRMVLPKFKGAEVEWSVAGEPVAEIINNNVVRGVARGNSILRMTVAQAAQGKALTLNGQPLKPGKAYDIGLKVFATEAVTAGKVAVNGPKKLTLHPLGPEYGYPATAKLDLVLAPESLPGVWKEYCFYISSNPSVAGVLGDGTIVAVKPGKAVITAYTPNMKTAKVTVTVKGRVTSLRLVDSNGAPVKRLTLKMDDYFELIPKFNWDAALKAVRWASSDSRVAVAEDGKVFTSWEGTARITATALDGSGTKTTVIVTVIDVL